MTRRFAAGTEVPVERSRSEIQRLLKRYGATRFVTGEDPGRYSLTVDIRGRWYRFQVIMPALADFRRPNGRLFTDSAQKSRAWEAEHRRRWRVLGLLLKAKLEATAPDPEDKTEKAEDTDDFDREFLPYLLLPDRSTFAEEYADQVNAMFERGQTPTPLDRLLPAPKEGAS